jgi:hypothetical protein
MSSKKVAFATLSLAALLLAAPAQAAKLGPYFPLPANLSVAGSNTPRDGLLKLEENWLKNGLDRLEKAKNETTAALEKAKADNAKPEQIAELEAKLKGIESDIASAKEELELAQDTGGGFERQKERKEKLLLNVNQWIRELSRQATQALKAAILSDGMAQMAAQQEHAMLSDRSDTLERATHDVSVEQWALTK